jgi:hypothetical protein
MIEGQDAALIEGVLREVMPEACATVGRANVRDVVKAGGEVHLVPLEGVSRIDWAAPLAMLAAGAAIVSHGLTVAKNLSDRKKNSSEISIEIKLSLPPEMAGRVDSSVLERLLTTLVSRL